MSGLPPGWTKIDQARVRNPAGEIYTQKIPMGWTIDKSTKKVTDPNGNQFSSLIELIYGIRKWEEQ